MTPRSILQVLVAATLLAATSSAQAGHAVELGTGWQNTGASREMRWWTAIQGSRKDVPLHLGWRWVGERRVYFAPFARLEYVNFWSLGGAGNLLGVTVAPAGLGVYLSRPPAALAPAQRHRRWFSTLDINFAALQLGGNVTPGSPTDARIPDPNAHRDQLRAAVANGGVPPELGFTQRYPLGDYSYVSLAVPIHFRAWNQATRRGGFGLFVEVVPLILEWQLGGGGGTPASASPAYGFNVTAGATVVVF